MLIILGIIAARSFSAVADSSSRRYSLILIGGTAFYAIMDGVFITCHLSGGLTPAAWKIVSFIFYVAYTVLPFVWHVFVRNFVGSTFGKVIRRIELIPIVILLGLVVVTPFTGALYYFDEAGMYSRGPVYDFYALLNYFYYAESLLDLLIISARRSEQNERYAFRAMLISFIMLIGAVVNGSVIPQGTIFPFMPFCSVIVTMLAFYFIATKDSELVKEQQQEAVQEALEKAQEASEKAQEASRAKTDFLSRMSHDMRTPMNGIINLTELALLEPVSDRVHDYLEKSLLSSRFLLGLINDVLDMSRIENGKMVLSRENLTRTEFLNMVDTVITPIMAEKHLNFHQEVNPGKYTIAVDKLRFNQIFFNLLSNAAKFTPDGGDVWFEVTNLETENNRLRIKFVVRDNGIGMSEEFQKHLFEPFAQEHSTLTDKKKGTGLGLPIVKSLVDAMGGTITVKSKVNEGTEFTVLLDVDIVSKAEVQKPVQPKKIRKDLNGMKVLLVEDNEINTYLARIIVENAGGIVTEAVNGQEAVDLFKASRPFTYEAILMDVRMPVMDGLEATRIIRSLERPDAKTVPIAALTADAFDEERKRTIEAGMNFHLSKPFDSTSLYEILWQCAKLGNGERM